MPSPTRVSVIIPAMNAEPYVGTALESLKYQGLDFDDLDIIFIDDGSTDRTGAIVAEFAHSTFPHLRIVHNETNVGLAAGRNQGLALADGELITFLDGDDWYARGHLRHMVDVMNRLDADFIKTDFTEVRQFKRNKIYLPEGRREQLLNPRDTVLPVFGSSMIDYPHVWSGVYSRRLLERGLLEFDPELLTAEDRPWVWRLHLEADSMAVTNSPGILYRRNVAGSLTQILDERQLLFIKSFDEVVDVLEAHDVDELFWLKLARNWLAILAHHLKRSGGADRPYRRQLLEGARHVSGRIPAKDLEQALEHFGRDRSRQVYPVLRTIFDSHHFDQL